MYYKRNNTHFMREVRKPQWESFRLRNRFSVRFDSINFHNISFFVNWRNSPKSKPLYTVNNVFWLANQGDLDLQFTTIWTKIMLKSNNPSTSAVFFSARSFKWWFSLCLPFSRSLSSILYVVGGQLLPDWPKPNLVTWRCAGALRKQRWPSGGSWNTGRS